MTEKEFQQKLAGGLKTLLLQSKKRQKHVAEELGVNTSFLGNVFAAREKASVYRLHQMLESMGKPGLLEYIESLHHDEPSLRA